MKKVYSALVVVFLLGLGAYLGPLLFAQPQRPAINTMPKVAVINVRAVLKENKLAKALQTELDETLKPYKAKADKLSSEITVLENVPASQRTEKLADAIIKKRGDWEAVNADILKVIDEKYKERMPRVWSEVNQAIEAVAKTYGFQMVLGHSDPEDGDMKMFQGAKTSKLRTTDMGGTVMPYVHGSIDITPVVIKMLAK